MRTLAGHLRTIAVYIESNDVDSIFRQRTRDVLRERGRTALLEWKPDVERLRAEVAVYGITLDRRFLELFDAAPMPARNRALDTILREGASPVFRSLATTIERLAPRFDQDYVRVARVATAGQDAAYWAGYCSSLLNDMAHAAALEAIACGGTYLPFVGPWFTPTCAAITGVLAVLGFYYFFYC